MLIGIGGYMSADLSHLNILVIFLFNLEIRKKKQSWLYQV